MLRTSLVLAATLLVAACVEPPTMRPRPPTPGVPGLRVTSFNVNLKKGEDPETIAAVGAAGADIVCLQETNATWEASVRAAWSERYPYMAFRHDGRGAGGLAVLSRFPFEDHGVIPGFDDWHPGWLVVVHTEMGPVQILQVHLRPPVSGRAGYVRSYLTVDDDHRDEIRYLEAHRRPALPTLVLGDFNEEPDGPALRYLRRLGFRNVLPLFRPGQETYRYEKSYLDQAVVTLDHILYDARFRPLNAFVQYRGNSDHLPVVAVLEAARWPLDGVGDDE